MRHNHKTHIGSSCRPVFAFPVESKQSFQKSNWQNLEIKKSFQKSNGRILEIKKIICVIVEIKKSHFRNQKDKFWKNQKIISEIKRTIKRKLKKIVSEIKQRINQRIKTSNYFSDTPPQSGTPYIVYQCCHVARSL